MRPAVLLFLIFHLPLFLAAQGKPKVILLRDHLDKELRNGWRFANGDDMARAGFEFNDSGWKELDPILDAPDEHFFSGIAWFRLHFIADSGLVSQPIAISIQHSGASEVYLDGKLLFARGEIRGEDATVYMESPALPTAVWITDTGRHVLAVRYANWAGLGDGMIYRDAPAGFSMSIIKAEPGIFDFYLSETFNNGALALLAGIFSTLFFLHLLFFLYNRSDMSNLWFSAFSLSIALLFLSIFLIKVFTDPVITLSINTYTFLLLISSSFAMSGFLNALFSTSTKRFRIITGLCVVVAALFFFANDHLREATICLIAVISLEAIFLITRAVYRRVPGARIIGSGLAALLVMLLIFVTLVLTNTSVRLSEGSMLGIVIVIMLCLSVLSIPVSMSVYLAHNFWTLSKHLKFQLRQVEDLSRQSREHEAEKQRMLQHRQEELEHEVALRTREVMQQKAEIEGQHIALIAEKKKGDDLLRNILPEEVAEELKQYGRSAARLYEDVTVLFTDFANFTQMSEEFSPEILVAEIDACFTAFDGIIERYGLEKIKTVGDAYIAVAGLPARHEHHAESVVHAALDIRDFMDERRRTKPKAFGIRLGVHSGPVVAGIVGLKKFAYDIWGDTVNTAARMEQHGEVGRVNVSQVSYELLKNDFAFTYRGEVEAKHKGKMGMYFAERVAVEHGGM